MDHEALARQIEALTIKRVKPEEGDGPYNLAVARAADVVRRAGQMAVPRRRHLAERTVCYMTAPHAPHRWDSEDCEPLRYRCEGVADDPFIDPRDGGY